MCTFKGTVGNKLNISIGCQAEGYPGFPPETKICIGCGWYREYILSGRRPHQPEGRDPATFLNGKTRSFPFSPLILISISLGSFLNASVVATVLNGYFQVQVPSIL